MCHRWGGDSSKRGSGESGTGPAAALGISSQRIEEIDTVVVMDKVLLLDLKLAELLLLRNPSRQRKSVSG